MISEFVEKLIDRLEGLKKSESDREDYSDNHDYYDDWEYAFGDGASYGRHYAYGRSIKIIKELAEEYKDVPDTNVGKWIPVSESLPDYGIEVIAYYKSSDSIWIVSREQNGSGRDVWENKYGDYEDVDAYDYWQSLPEPYKGE